MFEDAVRHGFKKRENAGVVYFTIPAFDDTGLVRHGFSSRIGGVSKGPFESLCFSLSREKNPDNFRKNIQLFARAAGVEYSALTAVNYAHGDGIYSLEKEDRGKGITIENDIPSCDALVCDSADVAAITMHADCVPLFYLDAKTGVCCIAHSGWRGVVQRLPEKIIRYLESNYNSNPSDILAGIGPHIMQCCFEVGDDVKEIFEKEFGSFTCKKYGDRWHVDMQSAILSQFEISGLRPENVTVADLCTSCHEDLFYSHRRDRGNTGAMASLLQKI